MTISNNHDLKNNPLLHESEVAKMLKVSLSHLQHKRQSGGFIPFVKISRSVRYKLSDVLAHIEANTFNSTSNNIGGKNGK